MNHENTMLSERSRHKTTNILPIGGPQNRQIQRNRKQNRCYGGLGAGDSEELLFNRDRVSVCNNFKIMEKDSGCGCTPM